MHEERELRVPLALFDSASIQDARKAFEKACSIRLCSDDQYWNLFFSHFRLSDEIVMDEFENYLIRVEYMRLARNEDS